jgi:hypothetical protein
MFPSTLRLPKHGDGYRKSPDARTLASKSSAQCVDKYLANSVEVNFKDQYISRRDMWKFVQDLEGASLFKN